MREHIKRVAKVYTGSTPPTNNESYYDSEDVLWYSPGDIAADNIILSEPRCISKKFFDENNVNLYPSGTVLMVGIGATVGKVGYAHNACYSNQQINALVFDGNKVLPKYGAYFLLNKSLEINKKTPIVTLQIFNQSKVKQIIIDYPSVKEQQRIVDYLDEKLSAIDRRVSVLEKQRDAYMRLKKSMIHQAVTRGLNPNVPLKDSGVEWIGIIPEHWEVKRLKDVVGINERTLGENTDYQYQFRYIDISNVSGEGEISLSEPMTFYDAPSRARRILCKGDTIISTVRTYLRAIALIDFDAKDIIASTGFAVLTPKDDLFPKFLAYVSRSNCIVDSVCSQSTGVSYPAISTSRLSVIELPLPPLSEQRAIANHLDEKCAKIDAAIENIGKQIDASKRLKRAVINEAISGK